MKYKSLIILIFFPLASFLSGCGQECYPTLTQLKAAYEQKSGCNEVSGDNFGTSSIGEPIVKLFVCSGPPNYEDVYANFRIKDGKFCRLNHMN